MVRIFRNMVFTALVLSLFSCGEKEFCGSSSQEGLVLVLDTGAPVSRAVQEGETSLNENLINTVHYFLYPEGKTDADAVLSGFFKPLAQGQATVRLSLNEAVLNNVLFPRPYNTCDVYVIANLPQDVPLPDDLSLESLRNIAIEADFQSAAVQESFVMDGLAKVQVTSRTDVVSAKGTVLLDRVAAKLTLSVSVAPSYTDTDGAVWTPMCSGMKVDLMHCVRNAVTCGEPSAVEPSAFNYTGRGFSENAAGKYYSGQLYSYPAEWKNGDSNEPYFHIMLPWTSTGPLGTRYQNCYYKVILSGNSLDKNNWYNINLRIGILGSFIKTEETLLLDDITYYVVDWTNGLTDWSGGLSTDTAIGGAHYLVMEQTHFELHNQSSLALPFISSHACEIVSVKCTRPVYSEETVGEQTVDASGWVSIHGNEILFNHALVNDIDSKDAYGRPNYDYAPYEITFRLRHIDEPDQFYEDVTIIQYPAMVIVADKNTGGNIVSDSQTSDDDKGYVYVNNNQKYSGSNWQVVRSCMDGGNNNPNMYLISTTVLPSGSGFVIGETRQDEYVSGSDIGAGSSFGGQTLEYYYQSLDDELSKSLIAPKYRIASSYGKCGSAISMSDAIRRCAAYQEQGYPAGRWRVPTLGEMQFITKLSYDGVIPQLFTSGSRYWTSAGAYTYGETLTSSTSTTAYVRCVYDEWYWENSDMPKVDKGVFTWGDELK